MKEYKPRVRNNKGRVHFAIVNNEYYGYSVKVDGKLYRFNHDGTPRGSKQRTVELYDGTVY